VVGRFARIGPDTIVEDAVVGDDATIGARNELRNGVRIWPEVALGDSAVRFSTDV
jgi:mannose-1-phosphate guanylyltransferase